MNDDTSAAPELDQLVAALRSDARPDELAGEASTVDAMASTLASTEVLRMSTSRSRVPRVAAIVAASVIGVGGLAAAAGGTLLPEQSRAPFDQAPPESRPPVVLPAVAAPATTTTTTEAPAAALAPVIHEAEPQVLPGEDDPATAFDETLCAEGNHGRTVSSVAHSVEPGPLHGSLVREAAQSSCGKTAGGAAEVTASAEEDESGEHGPPAGRGNGNGKGKGNAKGNAGGDDASDD